VCISKRDFFVAAHGPLVFTGTDTSVSCGRQAMIAFAPKSAAAPELVASSPLDSHAAASGVSVHKLDDGELSRKTH